MFLDGGVLKIICCDPMGGSPVLDIKELQNHIQQIHKNTVSVEVKYSSAKLQTDGHSCGLWAVSFADKLKNSVNDKSSFL
jgi:hypothetical protein